MGCSHTQDQLQQAHLGFVACRKVTDLQNVTDHGLPQWDHMTWDMWTPLPEPSQLVWSERKLAPRVRVTCPRSQQCKVAGLEFTPRFQGHALLAIPPPPSSAPQPCIPVQPYRPLLCPSSCTPGSFLCTPAVHACTALPQFPSSAPQLCTLPAVPQLLDSI